MAESKNVLKIPVFGIEDTSLLGCLYDARAEKIVPGVGLWDPETINVQKTEQMVASDKFDVVLMDSWNHKFKSLNVPDQLKLSVFIELLDLKNFAAFFNEEKESKMSVKLSLLFEKSKNIEGIPQQLTAIKNLDFPELLSKEHATHVIVGVQYGRRAMINMELDLKQDQETSSVLVELTALARKIAKNVKEETEKFTTKEIEILKKIYWTTHGDKVSITNFTTFEQINDLLLDLQQENSENQVPTQIWLLPLVSILPRLPKAIEIRTDLITMCIKQTEVAEEVKQKVKELCKNEISNLFPNFHTELKKFLLTLSEDLVEYKRQLKTKVLMIKDGTGSEEDIVKIMEKRNSSPFALQFMEKWVKKAQEINSFLTQVINIITTGGNNIQVSKVQRENEMLQGSAVTFVLFINSFLVYDPFLRHMEDFTKNGLTSKACTTLFSKNIFPKALEMVKSFKEFALANRESNEIVFIATEKEYDLETAEDLTPISTKMFRNGVESVCPVLPSKPENVIVEDVSHQMITISWEEPQNGSENILQYTLTAKESNYAESSQVSIKCIKNDELQLKLENLSCGSTYSLTVQGTTLFGLSPKYDLQVKTLVAGPPLDLRANIVHGKGFLVSWSNPEVKHFDVNIIGFIVRLDVQNDEEGCLDHVKDEIAPNGDGFEVLADICETKTYFITVTTMTDTSKGYHSRVIIKMQKDSDILSLGLQSLKDALKIKELKSLFCSTQTFQILNHILGLKQEVESNLQDKSKIMLLLKEILRTEEFGFFLCHVKQKPDLLKNCELEALKIIENIFLPISENSSSLEFEDLKKFISFVRNDLRVRSQTLSSIEELISTIFYQNQEKSLEMDDLTQKMRMLVAALKLTGKIPLVIAIDTILYTYGFDIKSENFKANLDSASVVSLIEKMHYIISKVHGATEQHVNIELEVLFGFLEIEKYPKGLYETYVIMKENNWPTTTIAKIKKYLSFWRDEEIKDVLEAIQKNEEVERFCCIKMDWLRKPQKVSSMKSQTLERRQFVFSDSVLTSDETKLNREDVFSIDLFQTTSSDKDYEKHLIFLKQLLSLDCHCRNQVSAKSPETSGQINTMNCNDDDDFFSNTVKSTSQPKKFELEASNADLVQKTLSICDLFLLQDVYEKMASCQIAVPVICKKESNIFFNLWATRTIKKKWVTTKSVKDVKVHDQFITKIEMGTISFCRIGKTRMSKSKLANLFLSSVQGWSEHSYFLHRDIDSESKLNQGSIESCWYCPEGRPREHLKDIHTIYNLRGDIRENREQFKFLLGISSVIVILVDNDELQKEEIAMLKAMEEFVIIVNLSQDGITKCMGKKVWLNAKNMNPKKLSESLIANIPSFSQKLRTLEDHAEFALSLGINVDERNEACQIGKKAAEEFIIKLKQYDITDMKSNVVPLQGKLWQQWGKLDKEESRHQFIGNTNPQKYSSDLRDKKKQLREAQFKTGVSCEIQLFLEKIIKFRNTPMLPYFIAWCQMNLNEMSEKHLPIILKEYNNSAKELSKLVKRLEAPQNSLEENKLQHTLIQSLIDHEKKNIKNLSEQFTIASFGIEHIFREFSQVYESYENEDQHKGVSTLPKLMADLFIMGYPFEIMDGDASHVPLTWIKQVLLEVKKKLGKDVNVFVLSILGIQSSGKSTLLNTMFGSKFAVSSGRCTKGVFLQLIPVSSNLCKKINCDYFIIMDSEGLRSPELSDSFRHDNEIATLVACLANTTVINFWGQTFSKDMADIMQIAAHAYIRMKEVKIKSSFHMIFAGVPDITAEEKNRLGVGKILDELNKMILKIARDEGRIDIFSGLSSIFPLIQEQLDQIVIPEFLPALWQGSMNPPESRYGEIVQQLKDSICIGLMQQQSQGLRSQPLSEFLNRLSDIWEAIKQENFIFGFKNSQAVAVFGEIQKLYDKELAQLRKKFFELSYQHAEECLCDAVELKEEIELFRKYTQKVDQFILPQVEFWQDTVVEQLRAHIVQMPDPEMAATHLSTFSFDMKKKVLSWIDREKMNTKEKIVAICRKERNAPMKREQFRKKCLIKAREVAGELKKGETDSNSLDTSVIQDSFEEIFNLWIQQAQFEDQQLMSSVSNLFDQIWCDSVHLLIEKLNLLHPKSDAALHNMISTHYNLIKDTSEDDPGLFNISLQSEDLNSTENWIKKGIKKILSNNCEKQIKSAKKKRNEIIKTAKEIIFESKKKAASHFSYVAVIADILYSTFEGLSGPATDNFEFSKTFKYNVLIKIFGASVKKMAALQMEHMQRNSIAAYLQSKKSDLYREFESECKTANNDARSGMRFIKHLLCPIIVEQIKLTVGSTVFDAIISKQQFSQKNTMMFYILKDLLSAPFEDVLLYIKDYKKYVKRWINTKVTYYCGFEEFLEACITNKIKAIILSISDVLQNIAADANQTQMTLFSWWTAIDEKLKGLGFIYQQSMTEVVSEMQSIQDFAFISGQMMHIISDNSFEKDTLKLVVQTATDQVYSLLEDDNAITQVLDWFVVKPINALEEQRIGCTAQCPFCGAVCAGGVGCQIEGSSSQKHRAEIHMPKGINGYRYEKVGNPKTDDRLVSNICTSMISSNSKFKLSTANKLKYGVTHDDYIPYSEANNLFYDWHIHALPQASATAFWQYIFVKYQSKFAKHYVALEANDIPRGWMSVTTKDAFKNLREMYTVQEELSSDSDGESDNLEDICIVCLVNKKEKFCFSPCGHSNFCRSCATLLLQRRDRCPTCRAPIERIQEIFD